MRTSVLVASFALLAIALLAPASAGCVGKVLETASSQTAFKAAKASASADQESLKVATANGVYEKDVKNAESSASTREGAASKKSLVYADTNGNKVKATKSSTSTSASDVTSKVSSSVEKVASKVPLCGCAKVCGCAK